MPFRKFKRNRDLCARRPLQANFLFQIGRPGFFAQSRTTSHDFASNLARDQTCPPTGDISFKQTIAFRSGHLYSIRVFTVDNSLASVSASL